MNPINIQEYVSMKVIEHMKYKDKEIERLKRGLKLFSHLYAQCIGCKEYIGEFDYIPCSMCFDVFICDDCDRNIYGKICKPEGDEDWECNKCTSN